MPAGSGDRWPEDYERGRPGWPPAAVEVVGVPSTATVLDLGAGTGKLTRLLVERFPRVIAVEPADAMRRFLERLCPTADARSGAADAIPLADASVDAVFAAQAFHWFDDEASITEIDRVLRPGGRFAALFNSAEGEVDPPIDDVLHLLLANAPADESYVPLDLGGGRPPPFAHDHAQFVHRQSFDRESLVAFYASMGWVGDLPDTARLSLLDEVRSRLQAAEYTRDWLTDVYWR
jgi:SAM-dependent methyltransferase